MIEKSKYIILLDNGHGINTPGKQSPDKSLQEYKYAREIVQKVYSSLKELGYNPYILVPEQNDIPLNTRVKRANKLCNEYNKKALLVSIHCNAVGCDGKWHNANGWSVFVAQNASTKSKTLAKCLKEAAEKEGLKIRLQYPDKAYWVQSLAMCRDTNCPAVLTENLFQDNKEDVKFLLSKEGKEKICNLHVKGIIDYLQTL